MLKSKVHLLHSFDTLLAFGSRNIYEIVCTGSHERKQLDISSYSFKYRFTEQLCYVHKRSSVSDKFMVQ